MRCDFSLKKRLLGEKFFTKKRKGTPRFAFGFDG